MKKYKLQKLGNLFFTTGAIKGVNNVLNVELLINKGSTFTVLPWESLETLGCEPALEKKTVRMITANGIVLAPRVKVDLISSLGIKLEPFFIVAHSLPTGLYPKGLLGMDFLKKAKAVINTFQGEIEIQA